MAERAFWLQHYAAVLEAAGLEVPSDEVLEKIRELSNRPNDRIEFDFPVGSVCEIVGPNPVLYTNPQLGKKITVTGGTIGQRETYPGMVWGHVHSPWPRGPLPEGFMPEHLKRL